MNALTRLNFNELPQYLDTVRRVFDVPEILAAKIDSSDIVRYYEDSYLGYSVFHSHGGAIHMALNFEGKYDPDGYYGPVRIVQEHIQKVKPTCVLELASGRGFNSKFLSGQNDTSVQFHGVDLTPAHVRAAQKSVGRTPNLHFELGDFHKLRFQSAQFDLVFVIESFCYATDMAQALSEVQRVLKPGGHFIVIDGYRKADIQKFDAHIQLASQLVEKTMAIPQGWVIDDWIALTKKQGFSLIELRDVSHAIMPNLLRFHVLAKGFFKFSFFSKMLIKLLPPAMIKNAIAGLLMPYTVSAGAQGYYVVVLQRASQSPH